VDKTNTIKPIKEYLVKNFFIAGAALLGIWGCQSSSQPKMPETTLNLALTQKPLFPVLSQQEIARYHNEVDAVLNKNLLRGRFNGAILVAKNGTIVYEKYVGFSDLRTKDSLNADVPFQIASTSKPFTAAAVLKLAEQGKLSLEDPISKYFPGIPYEGVTVKMLLNHRSGLPNYLNYMEHGKWPRTQLATNGDVVKTMIDWKPVHAYQPDRHFNYCNTNYVLLASIVEQVSGMDFPTYMKQNIFEPLGMSNTFVQKMGEPLITQSFQPNGDVWTLDFSDGPYGDKNMYSTVRDLLKWDQAWYADQVVSPMMRDSAFKSYSHEKPGVHNYGLGWRLLEYPNGKKVVYHNGHWHGFNSAFARLTDENATIIILSNRYNPYVYQVAKKLYNIFGNYDGRQEDGEG
jgi:CubicO group peptidase (beta-lactamase class C family)